VSTRQYATVALALSAALFASACDQSAATAEQPVAAVAPVEGGCGTVQYYYNFSGTSDGGEVYCSGVERR
jgi:hypothetical protein